MKALSQPLFASLRGYDRQQLGPDLFSGVLIALLSIPISMGYAQLAGLPPVYGLYGSLIPILLFAMLSTTREFIFGVDAAPAAMSARCSPRSASQPAARRPCASCRC